MDRERPASLPCRWPEHLGETAFVLLAGGLIGHRRATGPDIGCLGRHALSCRNAETERAHCLFPRHKAAKLMRLISVFAFCGVIACAPLPSQEVSKGFVEPASSGYTSPVSKDFAPTPGSLALRSNTEIAADFIDLEFRMESGRALSSLTRFDGPISVALQGDVPSTARTDLSRLIARLRTEAGLDIRASEPDEKASIVINFHPRAEIQRVVPSAACFVVPRAMTLAEYRARRNTSFVDWATLTRRETVAIFVPSDTSPQEVRDCLHEEMAQAMGPLNDLYRLSDSVFNDDNFNTVLTGFDMLVLRVHYSADLANGMTETDVAARLPAVLARLNPAGEIAGSRPAQIGPRSWNTAVAQAFGRGAGRQAGADAMLALARAQGWQDSRLGFAYFATGRVNAASDPQVAISAFSQAAKVYRSLPGAAIHAAHVDTQMAVLALSAGQPEQALQFADRAIPIVRKAENASLLATLMLIQAEALSALGRDDDARAVRLDSQGWARYGFGEETHVRARASEIAAIAARGGRS